MPDMSHRCQKLPSTLGPVRERHRPLQLLGSCAHFRRDLYILHPSERANTEPHGVERRQEEQDQCRTNRGSADQHVGHGAEMAVAHSSDHAKYFGY